MSSILKNWSSSLFAAIFSLQALKHAYPVTGPPLSLVTGPTGFYLGKHDAAGSEEMHFWGGGLFLRQVLVALYKWGSMAEDPTKPGKKARICEFIEGINYYPLE